MKTAREYVVSFFHYTGDNKDLLNSTTEADIRFKYADGFGSLGMVDHDNETIGEMLWDWSHVRDSSADAFDRMARAINEVVTTLDLGDDDLLYDECQPTYKELRAEFDYYTLYEPTQTQEIARLDHQLRNY